MRQRHARFGVELPCHRPFVGAELGSPSRKLETGPIVIRDSAFGVGRIDRDRKVLEDFAIGDLAITKCLYRAVEKLDLDWLRSFFGCDHERSSIRHRDRWRFHSLRPRHGPTRCLHTSGHKRKLSLRLKQLREGQCLASTTITTNMPATVPATTCCVRYGRATSRCSSP